MNKRVWTVEKSYQSILIFQDMCYVIDAGQKDKSKRNSNEMAKWILIRNGEVRNVFASRREAVKHFKKLLKQTLSDFEKQDRTDEYDYSIKIPAMEIKPVEEREAYLSLT